MVWDDQQKRQETELYCLLANRRFGCEEELKRLTTAMWVLLLFPPFTMGQRIDSYLGDMRDSLRPYGAITASTCHAVEIDLVGPWGSYAIPDGLDKHGEITWSIVKANNHRLFVDLADLDEDKVTNHPIFSLDYIRKHQPGTKWVADIPTVMIQAKGLSRITVHQVDLEKLAVLSGQASIPESDMGLKIDEKQAAGILFSDQQHADYFQKAVEKAIVLCKAQ